jgi:hypothetical protein
MPLITYQGVPVGIAGPHRVFIVPTIASRPSSDPLKQFVCHLVLYARDRAAGWLPGEPARYLPGRAERYVREQLMPWPMFQALQDLPDAHLAEMFNVPPEQIRERRRDLLEPTDPPPLDRRGSQYSQLGPRHRCRGQCQSHGRRHTTGM